MSVTIYTYLKVTKYILNVRELLYTLHESQLNTSNTLIHRIYDFLSILDYRKYFTYINTLSVYAD